MWQIFEHRRVSRQVRRLPTEILKRYEKWKDIAMLSGPRGLRVIRGFNDEPLSGELRGYRSSRLNQQYRVIYRVERDQTRIDVENVTAHNYRKKT